MQNFNFQKSHLLVVAYIEDIIFFNRDLLISDLTDWVGLGGEVGTVLDLI